MFLIESGNRLLAYDLVDLAARIKDAARLFESPHGSRGCWPKDRILHDVGSVQFDQRLLDLADVWATGALKDMRRVRHGAGFEFRITAKSLGLKSHRELSLSPLYSNRVAAQIFEPGLHGLQP